MHRPEVMLEQMKLADSVKKRKPRFLLVVAEHALIAYSDANISNSNK